MESRAANLLKIGEVETIKKLNQDNLSLIDYLEKICGGKQILATTFPGLFAKNIPQNPANEDASQVYLYFNTPAAIRMRDENFALLLKEVIEEALEIRKILEFYCAEIVKFIELTEAQIEKAIAEKKFGEAIFLQDELMHAKSLLNQMINMKVEIDKVIVQLTIQQNTIKAAINVTINNVVDIYKDKVTEVIKNFFIPSDGRPQTDFLNRIIKECQSELQEIPNRVGNYLRNNKNVTMNDLDKFVTDTFEKIITDKAIAHPDADKYGDIKQDILKAKETFGNKFWEGDIKTKEVVNNHLKVNQVREAQVDILQADIEVFTKVSDAFAIAIEDIKRLPLEEVKANAPITIPINVNAIEDNIKALSSIVNSNVEQIKSASPRVMSLSEKLKAARAKSMSNLEPVPLTPPPPIVDAKSDNPKPAQEKNKIKEDEKSNDNKKPDEDKNPDDEADKPKGPGRR